MVALWNVNTNNTYVNKVWTIDLHIVESESNYISLLFFDNNSSLFKSVKLTEGRNVIQPLTAEEYAETNFVRIDCAAGSHVVLTQRPNYRGALVSDGVDDYGVCTKNFALPDDYTVVAMREGINGNVAALICKGSSLGAFLFEATSDNNSVSAWSFGKNNLLSGMPNLFSYQTKSSYNGKNILFGEQEDTESDSLYIFTHNKSIYAQAALYSFGIFTRTLTEEELRIVENCMYAEWIAMTGKLEDIEYYDILDARFRSNAEDADKRNRWTGRLGKLHMTLNNYAYSGMSGWGGWPLEPFDTLNYASNSGASENKVKITKVDGTGWVCYMSATESIRTKDWKIKIHNPFGKTLYLLYLKSSVQIKQVSLNEGINIIPPATEEFTNIAFNMNAFSIGEYIEVEQLPLYGGALVSDGVDDYAVSDETIDEEIGGVVLHAEKISEETTGYFFLSGQGYEESWTNTIASYFSSSDGKIRIGIPGKIYTVNTDNIYGYSKSPDTPGHVLKMAVGGAYGDVAIYQLRLIKTQPTDTQLEAIKWQCRKEHDDYLIHMGWKDETPGWYGVEWDMTDPSPDLKRIGNMQMHRDLPVHVQMRGCLLNDDGVVQKYLDPDDWTSETLDGSAGQVMVHAPIDSYWRFEKDGNICRAKFSPTALPGFKRTPQGFISAHEATVQRSTNKLCSVVNTDPDYRGGINEAEWDGTYRSLLGMPATEISRTNFRTYARNRKPGSTEWNCMTYDFQKLLYWLFVVEYATLNTQKPVNTEKDANGFSQGGLGNGVTNLNRSKLSTFNGFNPFIPCGYTDELGNGTGEVEFSMPEEYDSAGLTVKVPRYRGVENPFGHVWQWTDGLNFRISADTSAGGDGLSRIFTCSDPAKFSDQGYDGYRYIGDAPRAEGYMKDIVFGEDGDIVPISIGGSATTYFCDYWYTAIPDSGESLRGVLFGGIADNGASAGFGYAYSPYAPSTSYASIGSRLCFIPEKS